MNIFLHTSSYIGLFIISIISGTILPGPSDPAIVGMFALSFNSWIVIGVATVGIMVGRVINYRIGMFGEKYVVQKKKWLKEKHVEQSKKIFNKYGSIVLLFTWIPFIDDPLTVVAGFFDFPFKRFLLYTIIAVLIRHVGLYALFQVFA